MQSQALIPVLSPSLSFVVFKATYPEIRRQERAGLLRTIGSKKRVRAAILLGGLARPRIGQRDTHNHETPDNPRGVWTFIERESK